MSSGIGLSEIILILVLIVICIEPNKIPLYIRQCFKFISNLRREIKRLFEDWSK